MKNFRKNLINTPPIHDYPLGLIHPYWARKPLNIIEEIIKKFSKEGDTILDPFMGSGTTIVAAVKNNRNVIGSDLNPLAFLLVNSIIKISKDTKKFESILKKAVEHWTDYALNLYKINENSCIEREFFSVQGEYTNGNFKLILIEGKAKPIHHLELKGKPYLTDKYKYIKNIHSKSISNPIDFSKIKFTENSRIAIHKGVRASDFFTERNQDFINYAHNYINNNCKDKEEIDFLKIFLSSLIPMLRLSDKKASSQWPYWRPKSELTSRNPIVAITRRYKSFKQSFLWIDTKIKSDNSNVILYSHSADKINNYIEKKIDLIITDPPYADHAPYIEYSELYWSLLNYKLETKSLWSQEIVKTNAIGRKKDSGDYEERLFNSFKSTLETLKIDGYFVFFYLDKNLNHWHAIKKAIKSSNCIIEDVIPLKKQRRSMKAVTSPGKTLDGDLIIICKKVKDINKIHLPNYSLSDVLDRVKGETYFQRFASFIQNYLSCEVSNTNEWKINNISRIL